MRGRRGARKRLVAIMLLVGVLVLIAGVLTPSARAATARQVQVPTVVAPPAADWGYAAL